MFRALKLEVKFGKNKRRIHPTAATAQSTRRLTAVQQRSMSRGAFGEHAGKWA